MKKIILVSLLVTSIAATAFAVPYGNGSDNPPPPPPPPLASIAVTLPSSGGVITCDYIPASQPGQPGVWACPKAQQVVITDVKGNTQTCVPDGGAKKLWGCDYKAAAPAPATS